MSTAEAELKTCGKQITQESEPRHRIKSICHTEAGTQFGWGRSGTAVSLFSAIGLLASATRVNVGVPVGDPAFGASDIGHAQVCCVIPKCIIGLGPDFLTQCSSNGGLPSFSGKHDLLDDAMT